MEFNNNYFYISSINEYIREVKRCPKFSHNQNIELAKRMQQGDKEARKLLITSNLNLVLNIAFRYKFIAEKNSRLDLNDLIQAGNIGLIIGIDKFNPERGNTLSTYVGFYIYREIINVIYDNNFPITTYKDFQMLVNKYKRFSDNFYQIHERKPTFNEIAEEFNKTEAQVEKELSYIRKAFVSLESAINPGKNDEKDLLLYEVVKDDINTEKTAINNCINDELIEYLKNELNEEELIILFSRLGINKPFLEFDKIGKIHGGISPQAVQQRYTNILKKLGRKRYIKSLK